MTTGVVLMTYGAPRDAEDVAPYLARVRGREPDPDLVVEMRRRYAAIGGSPLVRVTRAQAAALERALGASHVVEAGMRFSAPSIADAVARLRARGAARAVGVVLSPQWSPALMSGYERALADACAREAIGFALAREWYAEPRFVAAVADRLGATLASIDPAERPAVVLTGHSLPRRVHDADPAYVASLRATAELVARAAGLDEEDWRWAYQSAGHTREEWLRPDLVELFPALAAVGHRAVVVCPVQFVADHLEVLYDLDVAAAGQARVAGLRYARSPMPNDAPDLAAALAAVVERAARTLVAV